MQRGEANFEQNLCAQGENKADFVRATLAPETNGLPLCLPTAPLDIVMQEYQLESYVCDVPLKPCTVKALRNIGLPQTEPTDCCACIIERGRLGDLPAAWGLEFDDKRLCTGLRGCGQHATLADLPLL